MFSSGAIVTASAPFLFFLPPLQLETVEERAGRFAVAPTR
jgi:hypothetical protein